MTANEFNNALLVALKDRNDIVVSTTKLDYKNGTYDFIRIASKDISSTDRVLLIRAGIHGEEIAGPLTVLKHSSKIIEYAHESNVKVIIYPLNNPSGFENNKRYNIDNDKGDAGNNDFIRYELADGKIVDDLQDQKDFKKWFWSSDKRLHIHLPEETKLMHQFLKEDLVYNIQGDIDLHQDYISKGAPVAAYHYSFGDLAVYEKIIKKIRKIIPLYSNKDIDAGFAAGSVRSDKNGFIVRHDGSLSDLLYRVGVPYNITVETMGATPLSIACEVNLCWIYGLVNLLRKN